MTSNVAITRVRTGKGDKGETTLDSQHYRKYHPLVRFTGTLDVAQAHTDALPTMWSDEINPREIAQELLFRIGAAIAGSDQLIAIAQITELMELQLVGFTEGLKPLDSFIRCGDSNAEVHRLRAFIRQAECAGVYAVDTLEGLSTSKERIELLRACCKSLNVMSDWVFSFVWMFSLDSANTIDAKLRWKPWSETKIRSLNSG
jgi:cob(I)alamin adenosyltransferase